MKRIYLSGPMTERPDLNFPAFHAAAARLRALGYQVVSPAEIVPETKTNGHDAMRADTLSLFDCDTLALLDGWRESADAYLEMHVARRAGIKIVVEAEITDMCQAPLEPWERMIFGSKPEPVIAIDPRVLAAHQKIHIANLNGEISRMTTELAAARAAILRGGIEEGKLKVNVEKLTMERDTARDEIKRLTAAGERLFLDANRYRWLKSRPVSLNIQGMDLVFWTKCHGKRPRGEEADRVIDDAMAGREAQP